MKVIDDGWAVGNGYSVIHNRTDSWNDGVVFTPHGIVRVFFYGNSSGLDFAFRGRVHRRTFEGKRYTRRGIVTKAKQFAKEIVDNEIEKWANLLLT